jgi:hypothetical protein
MAIQLQGNSGVVPEVDGTSVRGLRVVTKPLEYGALGHYRHSIKLIMATSQAANSRLWTIRNSTTNLIVPTRLRIIVMATGTVTTGYRAQFDVYRLTSFSVSDSTNTATPTISVKRTSTMAAAPGGAAVRHVTASGVAAGMTSGTLTKDVNPIGTAFYWAATASASTAPVVSETMDDVNGTHPFVLAQNEGLLIENTIVGSGTANVIEVIVDCSWAEVSAY